MKIVNQLVLLAILALGVVLGFFLMMFVISGLFWVCEHVGFLAGALIIISSYIVILKFSRND